MIVKVVIINYKLLMINIKVLFTSSKYVSVETFKGSRRAKVSG